MFRYKIIYNIGKLSLIRKGHRKTHMMSIKRNRNKYVELHFKIFALHLIKKIWLELDGGSHM